MDIVLRKDLLRMNGLLDNFSCRQVSLESRDWTIGTSHITADLRGYGYTGMIPIVLMVFGNERLYKKT
eukprot:CAMPEP_0202502940 /NCGR_PEP_ID=MMETSP1361-20130828/40436_1 /ASSEMBLY_ACC=CAM_ASM_000849 /TAXON_ID=210615 /ORGANISM="Staurosira complex sp., Strain CCMP2646" /LENGTH=67 /DNA_ID=CAMNT_0049136063 /DNA_START=45 /DNA_END=244 /DNA_ORIENTATION=-